MKILEQLGISPAPWSNTVRTESLEALAAMLLCAEKEAPFTSGSGMSIAMNMARKAIKKAGG